MLGPEDMIRPSTDLLDPAAACEWHVDMGPCTTWKMETDRNTHTMCYHWAARSADGQKSSSNGCLIYVHGLGLHLPFQVLRHAPDGAVKSRGLFFQNSFADYVTGKLSLDLYGLDMEGHGLSSNGCADEHLADTKMFMSDGVNGVMSDVKLLVSVIRDNHGYDNNSSIILLGHSTGGLVQSRVAQEIPDIGGVVCIAPLYGHGRINNSEYFVPSIAKLGLRVLASISPRTVIHSEYGNTGRLNRDFAGVREEVLKKVYSLADLIDKYIALDRELDSLVCWPPTPIYANFAASVESELDNLFTYATDFVAPLLVIISKDDPVIPYSACERFISKISSRDAQLTETPPEAVLLHNPTIEANGVDMMNKLIGDWISNRVKV